MVRPIGWSTGVVSAVVVMSAGPAGADVFATGSTPERMGFPTLMRFTQNGQYAGVFPPAAAPFSEELNSLTRGPDGRLYFLDNILGTGRLLRVDPAGGRVTEVFNPFVTIPYGIAFGPGGTPYIGSSRFGTPAPTPTSVYRVDGPNTLTPVLVFPTVQYLGDIEWDPAGENLFVGIEGRGIRRYTEGGTLSDYTIPVSKVSDFEFGPDGNLYVATATGIVEYDPATGAELGPFVSPGAGGLMTVTDMSFGADGNLYVNSRDARKILRYDGGTGAFDGVFFDYGPSGMPTVAPAYVAQVPEPSVLTVGALSAVATFLSRRGRRSAAR
jgi:sugar lactone lactonase YvrE